MLEAGQGSLMNFSGNAAYKSLAARSRPKESTGCNGKAAGTLAYVNIGFPRDYVIK